jgi:uncharacterized membrane protein
MINPAVFTTTFLAAAVEIIEMVIIVVGVGAIRGWRSSRRSSWRSARR